MKKIRLVSSYTCENVQIFHTHDLFTGEHVITFWVNSVDEVSKSLKTEADAISSFKETCKRYLSTGTLDVVTLESQKRKPISNVTAVVNYFINKYIESNSKLTIKKLQQLVYTAYGLALHEFDVLLFNNDYVITSNGPCLDFISFLTANNPECYRSTGNILDFSFISTVKHDVKRDDVLDEVTLQVLNKVHESFFNKRSDMLDTIYTGLYVKWTNDSVRLGGMIDPDLIKHFFKEVPI